MNTLLCIIAYIIFKRFVSAKNLTKWIFFIFGIDLFFSHLDFMFRKYLLSHCDHLQHLIASMILSPLRCSHVRRVILVTQSMIWSVEVKASGQHFFLCSAAFRNSSENQKFQGQFPFQRDQNLDKRRFCSFFGHRPHQFVTVSIIPVLFRIPIVKKRSKMMSPSVPTKFPL